MSLMSRLSSGWRTLFGKSRLERDSTTKLRGASETLRDRYVAQGMSDDAARRAARLELGGEPLKDAMRDVRVGVQIETVFSDARYALRPLRQSPVFTSAAVLSLALGIGANAAIFTFINALLLRPLPVRDPSALVDIPRTKERSRNGLVPDVSRHRGAPAGADRHRRDGRGDAGPDYAAGHVARRHAGRGSTTSGSASCPATTSRSWAWTPSAGACSAGRRSGSRQRDHRGLGRRAQRRVLGSPVRPRSVGGRPHHPHSRHARRSDRHHAARLRRRGRRQRCGRLGPLTAWSSRDDLDNRRGTFTAFFGRLEPGVSRPRPRRA